MSIQRYIELIEERELLARDLFNMYAEDYLNPCLISCAGMSVHEIWIDWRLGDKL